MKILFLANRSSIHATRWANELQKRGHRIYFCSVVDGDQHLNKGIRYVKLKYGKPWGYIFNRWQLKTIIKDFRPDVLHVHYANGNGLLGAMISYEPTLLSVYGSDVYEFPNRSRLHKYLFQYIVKNATWVCSTGLNMAEEIYSVLGSNLDNISITPFGVDLNRFFPANSNEKYGKIIVGTIKKIEDIYGIDILIKAFAQVLKSGEINYPLELHIIGWGTKLSEMKRLAKEEGITEHTVFAGKIAHENVHTYFNAIDIFVALSRYESFGVAVIEASACEKPVVVSNVGGLPEVVDDQVTGLVVESENIRQAANAILKLAKDKNLRNRFGKNGRIKVKKQYDWNSNVDHMEEVYAKII